MFVIYQAQQHPPTQQSGHPPLGGYMHFSQDWGKPNPDKPTHPSSDPPPPQYSIHQPLSNGLVWMNSTNHMVECLVFVCFGKGGTQYPPGYICDHNFLPCVEDWRYNDTSLMVQHVHHCMGVLKKYLWAFTHCISCS